MKKTTAIIMILTMALSLCNSLSFAEETAADVTPTVQENADVIDNESAGVADNENEVQETQTNEEKEQQPTELTNKEKQQLVHEYIKQTVFELDDDEFKDENGQFTIDGTSDKYHVTWIAKSDNWSIHTTMFCNHQYRENVYETSKKLYDMIMTDGELIDVSEYQAGVKTVYDNAEYIEGYNHNSRLDVDRGELTGYEINHYANIYVEGGIENSYEFLIEDNYACISFDTIENKDLKKQYYRISNPKKVIDFLARLDGFDYDKEDRIYENIGEVRKEDNVIIDWENMTLNSSPMRLIDVLSFEVEVTEKLYHSAFKQIAELGENVKFELKHVEGKLTSEALNRYNCAIITVSGSKGEFCNRITLEQAYNKGNICLKGKKDYDGNTSIGYTGMQRPNWEMYLYAEGENNEFSSITVKFAYDPIWDKNDMLRVSAEGKNIEYTQYDINPSLGGIFFNLQFILTTDYDKLQEITYEVFKEAEEKREALGIKVGDISVRSISAAKIELDDINAPQWYSNLGGNVSLVLYGITKETPSGKECMPMLRFQGDDGFIWFNWSGMTISLVEEYYEFKWDSIESFDGKKIVKEKTGPEFLIGSMRFDESSCMELMTLNIGDATVEIKGEDFNTFGKDNLYSDDLIRHWELTEDDYWEGY